MLLKNIRFYVLVGSVALSGLLYWQVVWRVSTGVAQTIRLTQLFALTALTCLYLTLLIGPLVYNWRWLPWRGPIFRARRALGVSTFYFALLHAYLAFFKQLGGLAGLSFLSRRYLVAISLSGTALVILGLLASTSFDAVVKLLTWRRWKRLHRLVYVAGILILIHALLLGTHFRNLSDTLPKLWFLALVFLGFLEARRVDAYLQTVVAAPPRFGVATTLLLGLVIAYALIVFL